MNLADPSSGPARGTTPPDGVLKSGEVRKVIIDLIGTANRFQASHRIRLDISSSNFAFCDVNPNTGEPPGHQMHEVTALNTVYHERGRPSHLNLPVMPAADVTGRTP